MPRLLETLVMPRGSAVFDALPRLHDALDGKASILPIPDPESEPERAADLATSQRAGEPIDDDIALVACTSGSTGLPKGAMLSGVNLAASADATHTFLGGPGQWLLATPPDHIAGIQVLARSLRAGFTPALLDISTGFNPAQLPEAVSGMVGRRRYLSLVPLQLGKALGNPAATEALTEFDTVLVGGQAADPSLLERARAAGITVITTYGSSETCGGIIYDGTPLDGVTVSIDDEDRIALSGPMVSRGYRNVHSPDLCDGTFRTSDAGEMTADGRLRVLGRIDDVIISGGLKFQPGPIERLAAAIPGIREVVVVPVPDARLGQAIGALIVTDHMTLLPPAGDMLLRADTELVGRITAEIQSHLGVYATPRFIVATPALPTLPSGKVDRNRATAAVHKAVR